MSTAVQACVRVPRSRSACFWSLRGACQGSNFARDIKFDECIGCVVCARVCTKMTWDAIRMIDTDTFEELYGMKIN